MPEPPNCTQCGKPHLTSRGEAACTAHVKGGVRQPERRGEPCKMLPMPGQHVCWRHGGRNEVSRTAGIRRVREEGARILMETYGRKLDVTATDALLDEVQWTAGHVAWLRERVRQIEQAELTWGLTRIKDGGDDRGTTHEAKANVWLALYREERAHLVRVCSEAIKAGLDERRVRLAESQGTLVAQVLRAILNDLQLTPEQQTAAPEIAMRHLRALSVG
jgi:hypothetical protein